MVVRTSGGGGEAIGDGSAQRLRRLLVRRRSQARDAAGSAELEPGAGSGGAGAPRRTEARRHNGVAIARSQSCLFLLLIALQSTFMQSNEF